MPQTVNMTLEGLPHAFDELEESELEAYLDLTAIEGWHAPGPGQGEGTARANPDLAGAAAGGGKH